MRQILVTGGAGYLGSHLVELLLSNNYKVRVLDNLSFGDNALKILKKKYKFELIKGDIRDLRVVLNSMEGCDAVVHLAGIVGDPASKLDPIQSTEINYLSTKLIVDAAHYFQIKQFLFASTAYSVFQRGPRLARFRKPGRNSEGLGHCYGDRPAFLRPQKGCDVGRFEFEGQLRSSFDGLRDFGPYFLGAYRHMRPWGGVIPRPFPPGPRPLPRPDYGGGQKPLWSPTFSGVLRA